MPELDLSGIAPVTDAEAARLASPAAFADLAAQIMATEAPAAQPSPAPMRSFLFATGPTGPTASDGSHPRRRIALLAAIPVALAAVAALFVTVLSPSAGGNGIPVAGGSPSVSQSAGTGTGAGPNSQAAIQAVSFTKENGYITVVIHNPYADSSWYNADFARHHLNITLSLIAASPSFVGAIEEMSTDSGATSNEIKLIGKSGNCGEDGTGCVIGFRVPVNFHGQASMAIGRPTRPGEQYETTGSAFNKGEILYGLKDQVYGHPLSHVLALFAKHHVTVAVCRNPANNNINPSKAPGDWYVQNVIPWAPGQVLIWVGPTQHATVSPPAPEPTHTPESFPKSAPRVKHLYVAEPSAGTKTRGAAR
jgi:hypothetical protein